MTAPTREQIDAAVAFYTGEFGFTDEAKLHLAVLLSAIPALTAELDAERRIAGEAQSGWAHAIEQRDAERMRATSAEDRAKQAELDRGIAHGLLSDERRALAEQASLTLIEMKEHQETLAELDRRQGQLDREVTRRANAEAEVQRWQTATGHASPEAYRARVEPGAGVIERLASVFDDAADAYAEQDVSQRGNSTFAGIRAIVVALAEVGAEALPSVDTLRDAAQEPWEKGVRDERGMSYAEADSIHALLLSRLAPILGARRVLELPSREDLARAIFASGGTEQRFDDAHHVTRADYLVAADAVLDLLRSRSAPPTDEQLAEDAQADAFREAAVARREGRR